MPYNGEEVRLYWANSEQHDAETGFLFRDYTFPINSPFVNRKWVFKVIFRIVSAREKLASNKAAKKRFFVLDDEKPLAV